MRDHKKASESVEVLRKEGDKLKNALDEKERQLSGQQKDHMEELQGLQEKAQGELQQRCRVLARDPAWTEEGPALASYEAEEISVPSWKLDELIAARDRSYHTDMPDGSIAHVKKQCWHSGQWLPLL